ncbi:MAG: N-acetylmuramoyl-L-alanine amidase [bacterium]
MQKEIQLVLIIGMLFLSNSYAQLNVKIGIDPGHGGSATGAVGPTALKEKDVNLCTALALRKYMSAHPFIAAQIFMTRTQDVNPSFTARSNLFISNAVDFAISVHHNSPATNDNSNKTTVFVYCEKCSTTAGDLAESVVSRLSISTGLPINDNPAAGADAKCKDRADFLCGRDGIGQADLHMVREPEKEQIPSILVEVSFISNSKEVVKLRNKDYLDGNGWAIAAGLIDFLGFSPLPRIPDNGGVLPLSYSVLDVGSLEGFPNTVARAINASAQIVGQAWTADFSAYTAFLYTDGEGLLELVSLPGEPNNVALGINTIGEVVGTSDNCPACDSNHGWLDACEKDELFVFDDFSGFRFSSANDINARGQVVGSVIVSEPPTLRAYRYIDGVGMEDLLGSIGGISSAEAINDSGWVVGTAIGEAYFYSDNAGLTGLGWLASGRVSKATDINNSGQICGYSNTVASQLGGKRHAFVTTREAHTMQDLGVLPPFTRSEATAINSHGHIVGSSYDPAGDAHAFIYTRSDGMQDLNDMIDSSLGWELKWANDINDTGQIVGWGLHHGQQRAFRLTPMDGPTGITSPSNSSKKPVRYALSQNYPNPFNPSTTINYQIPKSTRVSITIYNSLGQKVTTLVDKKQDAGFYQIQWDGKDEKGKEVASGLYIVRLTTPDYIQERKVILLK